jgi:hypothetical protein
MALPIAPKSLRDHILAMMTEEVREMGINWLDFDLRIAPAPAKTLFLSTLGSAGCYHLIMSPGFVGRLFTDPALAKACLTHELAHCAHDDGDRVLFWERRKLWPFLLEVIVGAFLTTGVAMGLPGIDFWFAGLVFGGAIVMMLVFAYTEWRLQFTYRRLAEFAADGACVYLGQGEQILHTLTLAKAESRSNSFHPAREARIKNVQALLSRPKAELPTPRYREILEGLVGNQIEVRRGGSLNAQVTSEPFITLMVCDSLMEADFVQSLLGSTGITTFLKDEISLRLGAGLLNLALGGVNLQVHVDDFQDATKFVNASILED